MTAPADRWRADNASWFLLRLERLQVDLARLLLVIGRTAAGRSGKRWSISAPDAVADAAFLARDPQATALTRRADDLERRMRELQRRMQESTGPPALLALSFAADLSPFERDLLTIAVAPSIDRAFGDAYAELNGDPRACRPTLDLALSVSVGDPVGRLVAADCLMPSRPLRALGLVTLSGHDRVPRLERPIHVDDRVVDYLRGVNRMDTSVGALISEAPAPVGVGSAPADLVTLLGTADEAWPTLNLVGTIEGGALDVAARACATVGLRLFVLDVRRLGEQTADERMTSMRLLRREALLGGFAVLVDGDSAKDLGLMHLVDEVLERLAATVMVVSAERWSGAATIRRELDVVRLERPDRAEQAAMWRAALGDHAEVLNGAVDDLVQQFDLGPSAIGAVAERAYREGRGTVTTKALWRAARQESGGGLEELGRRIVPRFGWGDIVVPGAVRTQLEELAGQVANRGQVYERWGFGALLGGSRGITALFAGPSGAGKTMAAEIIAGHLDLDLFRVDLAGVVSKYVGETEKNLRRVFDAAERCGAILFFDEADALFGTRTEVRDSHDRYANIEVDYLLQRMEDYAGLAILATNRRTALDPAFLRRLRFVIDFPFPSVQDRRRIWEAAFPREAAVRDLEPATLAALECSGGNIRSIAVNAAFNAAGEGSPIGMEHVMRAAGWEYSKLAKPIAGSEFGEWVTVARP